MTYSKYYFGISFEGLIETLKTRNRDSVPAGIRTQYLLNRSLKCYRFTGSFPITDFYDLNLMYVFHGLHLKHVFDLGHKSVAPNDLLAGE